MEQTLVNVVLGGFGALLGFLLRVLWQAVQDLQEADKVITEKVSKVELLVTGVYVKREELASALNRVFEKLEHIEEKMEEKITRCGNHDKLAK